MFNLVPDIINEYWLGKQEEKKQTSVKAIPAEEFKKFCDEEPWAAECKVFDI